MTKFKPGDRVRVRGSNDKGEVTFVDEDNWITVKLRGYECTNDYHPELLIKLKPKRKAREWELMGHRLNPPMISSTKEWSNIVVGPQLGDGERVIVREILPKRKGSG